jgi:hypothetical protein
MTRSYTYNIPIYLDSERNAVRSSKSTSTNKSNCRRNEEEKGTSPPRTEKAVSFFQKVTVYEHIHHKDLDEREASSYWFQSDEYAQTQSECEETLKWMERAGKYGDSDEDKKGGFCCRGLEGRTKAGRREMQKTRSDSFRVVNSEQNRQWRDAYRTTLDARQLARAYRNTTEAAERLARLQGIQDEEYARKAACGEVSSSPSSNTKKGGSKNKSSFWGYPTSTKLSVISRT